MTDSNDLRQDADGVVSAAPCSAQDINPYETEDYQRYVAECSKHCYCDHEICEPVLAGAPCEGRIRDVPDDDDEPDYTLDDLEWSERYPHLV